MFLFVTMCSLQFKCDFWSLQHLSRGEENLCVSLPESPGLVFYIRASEEEREMPIFVLIRKPSTAFVGQQFDSLCFMACSQSMLHCFIIHASRGYHNGTIQDATLSTNYVVQCTETVHYAACAHCYNAGCNTLLHSVRSLKALFMFSLHSWLHIALCMP